MPCANCLQSTTGPHWGGYSTRCAHCCARLVRSARPLKHLQDAHLAAIEHRRPATPEQAAVLAALRELDAKLAGQDARNGSGAGP